MVKPPSVTAFDKTKLLENDSKNASREKKDAHPRNSFKKTVNSVFKLARPNFLFYSALLHYTGVLLARLQAKVNGDAVDNYDFFLSLFLQLTICVTHIGTHFWNEWADYEVDCLNVNETTWTGGSKVLKKGLLPRVVAFWLGLIFSFMSFLLGALTCERYLNLRHGLTLAQVFWKPLVFANAMPIDFIWIGLSVLCVAIMYSVEPFRLSAKGLGEVCVSYVLTFCTPAVSFTLNGGHLNLFFCYHIMPLFIINAARMIIMNIPDREGDLLGGKITSVVLLGEKKAQNLNNLLYIATFLYIIPTIPLGFYIKSAYLSLLPLRWWLSLYLNQKKWWKVPEYAEKLPFYESMFVIATVVALNYGLSLSLQ